MTHKPRLLTGDTPSGKLHLGHWVGSLENRVALQDDYDCYYLLANAHAYTTKADQPEAIKQSTIDIALDYLGAGIDPNKSTIVLESEISAIFELTTYLSMLVPYPRAMRNPTIKDEIRDKGLGDNYSLGFLLYQVIQAADILAFQAEVVPVGEDQLAHLELTREIARKFNQLYCGVNSHTDDTDYVKAGGIFPIPAAKLGRVKKLVGTTGPNKDGRLLKMSKSLNNSILLSDDNDTIQQKVMKMYTDPNRLKVTDPGNVVDNPLWIYHDTFNPDTAWVEEHKNLYKNGGIGDVPCKKKLIEVLVDLIQPMRERREQYAADMPAVMQILKDGAEKANEVTQATLKKAKAAMEILIPEK